MDFEKTQGKKDLVKALYSTEGLNPFGGNKDKFKVLAKNPGEPQSTTFRNPPSFNASITLIHGVTSLDDTDEIKIVTAEGMRKALSAQPGDIVRLTNNKAGSEIVYRARIRGYAKTFPGFFFSSYKQIAWRNFAAISFDDAANFLGMTLNADPAMNSMMLNLLKKEQQVTTD